MKQHKRNILTFTLDIFMRKPKLNKVQNNLTIGSFIHHWWGSRDIMETWDLKLYEGV